MKPRDTQSLLAWPNSLPFVIPAVNVVNKQLRELEDQHTFRSVDCILDDARMGVT